MKVAAVVVTYNRKELLRECLQALLKQTRPLDEIIVIDNASTDGTDEMVPKEFPQVTYVRLPENIGGAGGFHEGMKLAYEKGHDWIWVMDDDTIPGSNALEALILPLSTYKEEAGLLCSHVVWTNGLPHVMNVPQVSALITYREEVIPFSYLIKQGLIRIYACSFVSALISRRTIETVGLPIKEMFIYGDDIEFTSRVCKQFPCYYVPQSEVLHKTRYNQGVDIETVQSDRIWLYFFQTRNQLYLCRRKGALVLAKYCLIDWPRILGKALKRKSRKISAVMVLIKGLIAGFFFKPKVISLRRNLKQK